MDANAHLEVVEMFTDAISNEALKDAEQFLEESLTQGKSVRKERLLEKVLFDEQQLEYSRKIVEGLEQEAGELKKNNLNQELKSTETLRIEREEIQKLRAREMDTVTATHISLAEIARMRQEIQMLREAYELHKAEQEARPKVVPVDWEELKRQHGLENCDELLKD